MIHKLLSVALVIIIAKSSTAQELLETGGTNMPGEWIDRDTKHRIKRLTPSGANHASFYFHNNPFIRQQRNEGDRMVFYANEAYSGDGRGRQLYILNLKSGAIEKLTATPQPKIGEIVGVKRREVFYQVRDSVFATNIDTRKSRLIFVFPENFKGSITTLNADETLLAGAKASDEEKEILAKNPGKSSYFNLIYEAKLERSLFTIHLETGRLDSIYREKAWLNHVQFSPTDPNLLMYCHEGPWHKVDRIWTIDVTTRRTRLIHKRSMDMEIAGHEWFSHDGKMIWYDLQLPRGATFFVAGTNVYNGAFKKYELQRNEWSVHYNLSPSQQMFAGDGGSPDAVAKAPDGQWIYLFRPAGEKFISEKLVNMKHHKYRFEPNVHFTPDEKWVVFRANFEGEEHIYAVEIAPSGK